MKSCVPQLSVRDVCQRGRPRDSRCWLSLFRPDTVCVWHQIQLACWKGRVASLLSLSWTPSITAMKTTKKSSGPSRSCCKIASDGK